MKNVPKVRLGLVAVSRDCFPLELSKKRRVALARECRARKLPLAEMQTVIESEKDVPTALEELRAKNANVLVIFLGNFGPEGSVRAASRAAAPAAETAANLIWLESETASCATAGVTMEPFSTSAVRSSAGTRSAASSASWSPLPTSTTWAGGSLRTRRKIARWPGTIPSARYSSSAAGSMPPAPHTRYGNGSARSSAPAACGVSEDLTGLSNAPAVVLCFLLMPNSIL